MYMTKMPKRILKILNYPEVNSFDVKDEMKFSKLVVWIETNKIQRAPPNQINNLKNIKSSNWNQVYKSYLKFLGCPESLTTSEEQFRWLLGYAVQKEYTNKKSAFKPQEIKQNVPDMKTENPLDKLDLGSEEFGQGVKVLAKLLNITEHQHPVVTLKAIRYLLTKRLTQHAITNPGEYIVKGTPFPIKDTDLGFDVSDPVLKQAAKILRMLYIQDLRNLQTKINQLIVSAQNLTANPKTDTKLGKVGF